MSNAENRVRQGVNDCGVTRVGVAFLLLLGTALAAPSITLSKKTGPPTSEILVSGSGFEPSVGVDIYFDTKDEALVVTDGKGEFNDAVVYALRSALPGKHWVTAREHNSDMGDQESFVVYTNWPQFGFAYEHNGLNPYENVLSPSNVGNLRLHWSRPLGRLSSTPVLVDGILYTGSEDGAVYAFNARDGATLWAFVTGGAADATPAVDRAGYSMQTPESVLSP